MNTAFFPPKIIIGKTLLYTNNPFAAPRKLRVADTTYVIRMLLVGTKNGVVQLYLIRNYHFTHNVMLTSIVFTTRRVIFRFCHAHEVVTRGFIFTFIQDIRNHSVSAGGRNSFG